MKQFYFLLFIVCFSACTGQESLTTEDADLRQKAEATSMTMPAVTEGESRKINPDRAIRVAPTKVKYSLEENMEANRVVIMFIDETLNAKNALALETQYERIQLFLQQQTKVKEFKEQLIYAYFLKKNLLSAKELGKKESKMLVDCIEILDKHACIDPTLMAKALISAKKSMSKKEIKKYAEKFIRYSQQNHTSPRAKDEAKYKEYDDLGIKSLQNLIETNL